MTDEQFRSVLRVALSVERVVDEVARGGPYPDVEAVVAALRRAATPLSTAELAEALAHHPRIGERPTGEGAAQSFSRREQSAADASDPELTAALLAGNAEYEARFDQVFLIRAAGRSRAEVIRELTRRLDNDPETEAAEVAEELREIAALRLRQSLSPEEAA